MAFFYFTKAKISPEEQLLRPSLSYQGDIALFGSDLTMC